MGMRTPLVSAWGRKGDHIKIYRHTIAEFLRLFGESDRRATEIRADTATDACIKHVKVSR